MTDNYKEYLSLFAIQTKEETFWSKRTCIETKSFNFRKTFFIHLSGRAVAEPRLGLEGPGLTLGSQYISLKLELARA
jgi:hypothetical protein